jgi:segregation and condensation protein A
VSDPTTALSEKPFWLRPPWIVLFDLIKLRRLRPWDVNLAHILNSFILEMKRQGYIDFTASGVALLSSATIYRMKSELILKLQEPPRPPRERIVDFVPPPIPVPFRYEYTTTTLDDLITALEGPLKIEPSALTTQHEVSELVSPPPILEELDVFLTEIDQHIEELNEKIQDILGDETSIPFSSLTAGLDRLDLIRTFLMLLFLVSDRKIDLTQDEEFGEILITSPSGGSEELE